MSRQEKDSMRTDSERLLEHMLQSLEFPFYIIDAQTYQILHINEAARQGRDTSATTCHLLTHRSPEPCSSEEHGCPLQEVKRTGQPAVMVHTHYDKDNLPRLYEVHGYPIKDRDGNVAQMIEYSIDVTDRIRAEEESRTAIEALDKANALKEELIRSQEQQIQLMSTPIIEIWDGILVAPLVGFIDSTRGAEISASLLQATSESQSRGVIIDVTGIDTMNEHTASQLVRISKAISVLGAKVVISGISPAVAETMTEIEVDLDNTVTVRR